METRSVDPVVAGSSPVTLASRSLEPNVSYAYLPVVGSAACIPKMRGNFRAREPAAMPPHSPRIPHYRQKKVNGRLYAVVTLADGFGGRRDVPLGAYGTPESRQAYHRVLAEWEANGRQLQRPADQLSVNELVLRFLEWARTYYRRPDGTPARELADYHLSLRLLVRLYGLTPARAFGPLALKAVREQMLREPVVRHSNVRGPDGQPVRDPATGQPRREEKIIRVGWARGLINQRIGRIKRLFRWAVSEELLPQAVAAALASVEGLKRGRSPARETAAVKPVPPNYVTAILTNLLPPVRAMVELQLATGMRSGELCVLRGLDLETSGKVWAYRPADHKTSYRGHPRVICIGPRGQAILRPWLRPNLEEFLFQPRDSHRLRCAALRARRQTKVQPSQQNRAKRKPKKRPGERYTPQGYAAAIRAAIGKTNAIRRQQGEPEIPHWHPHQLRHTAATLIRKEFGLDAARAVLGHRSPAITEVYAEIDAGKASEVALKLG